MRFSFKASETLLGIETEALARTEAARAASFKASETLLGIETYKVGSYSKGEQSFKASETLLGIETCRSL